MDYETPRRCRLSRIHRGDEERAERRASEYDANVPRASRADLSDHHSQIVGERPALRLVPPCKAARALMATARRPVCVASIAATSALIGPIGRDLISTCRLLLGIRAWGLAVPSLPCLPRVELMS